MNGDLKLSATDNAGVAVALTSKLAVEQTTQDAGPAGTQSPWSLQWHRLILPFEAW